MSEFQEAFLEFILSMRWQDVVDILVVAVLIYQALRLIRGTRSMQMLVGLAVVFGLYIFSGEFELLTLNWVLSNFLTYVIIIMVILFQADIRKALTKMARLGLGRTSHQLLAVIGDVVRACFEMAEKRTGALIVFEREVGLKSYMDMGTPLNAEISKELLMSLFQTSAPLHDGAIVIQTGRIAAAGCVLPLATDEDISRIYGTRHRAAIGLTRETDAAVIVVSEERGAVALVIEGVVQMMKDHNELRNRLTELLKLTVANQPEEEPTG